MLPINMSASQEMIASMLEDMLHTSDVNHWAVHLELADYRMALNNEPAVIGHLCSAHMINPTHPEPMYKLVSYLRHEKAEQCGPWLDLLLSTKLTPDERYQGKMDSVHTYQVHELALIVLFYLGRINEAGYHIVRYLSSCPDSLVPNGLRNYRFYCPPMSPDRLVDLSSTISLSDQPLSLCSSSPSIARIGDDFLINIRYVNYELCRDGQFVGPSCGYVYNVNRAVLCDANLEVKDELFVHHPDANEDTYDRGLQDVRLWTMSDGSVNFTATTTGFDNNSACVAVGTYNMSGLSAARRICRHGQFCEKNWVHATDSLLVHSWSPIRIGCVEGACFVEKHTIDTPFPGYFNNMRGSSHATSLPNGDLMFLTHIVGYCNPRIYFHCLVVLSAETFQVKSYSYPFKLADGNVEYSAGLVVKGDEAIISYSVNDASTMLGVFKLQRLLDMLIDV